MRIAQLWILVHYALYHTYPHHDSAGLGTWTFDKSGIKDWIPVYPKGIHGCKNAKTLFSKMDSCLYSFLEKTDQWGFPCTGAADKPMIVAQPGDLM